MLCNICTHIMHMLSSMFFAQVKRLRLAKAQARAVISEMKKQSGWYPTASCSATLKFTPRSKPNNPAYLSHNQTIHCLFMGTLLLLGVRVGHHRTLHASRFLWTSDLVYFCKSSYFHTWTYLPIRGLKCREGGHAFWKSWSHQLGWVVHMCESIVSTSAPRHDRLRCRLVFHINSRGLSRPMVSINHKLYIIPFTRKTNLTYWVFLWD